MIRPIGKSTSGPAKRIGCCRDAAVLPRKRQASLIFQQEFGFVLPNYAARNSSIYRKGRPTAAFSQAFSLERIVRQIAERAWIFSCKRGNLLQRSREGSSPRLRLPGRR